ncbi:MAG: YggS family pyridoxal phosphate enzyme [Actinobacteria bacterium]|nr:YggS family pyridoxal phosphate enzyme [Actinomycetota bacterium]
MTGDQRLAELSANLAAVRDRVTRACTAAGREPDSVTLIAVTKHFPAPDLRRLASLGIADVGENRDQEARVKAAELTDLTGLAWHFIGQLQRNKARSVVRYADFVHTVDRPELVDALDAAAGRVRDRPLPVLLQVDLSEAEASGVEVSGPAAGSLPGRGGAAPRWILALAEAVVRSTHLRLAGLMAVAPLGVDPEPAFARLAEVAARLRAEHPAATMVSAGMSGDLELAVRFGATHLRVGTALLGGRPSLVR